MYHNVLAAVPSSAEPADHVSDEVRFLFCQVNIKLYLCHLLVRYVCLFVYPQVTSRETIANFQILWNWVVLLKLAHCFKFWLKGTLYLKNHMDYCLQIECNCMNIHRNKEIFVLNLHRKVNRTSNAQRRLSISDETIKELDFMLWNHKTISQ